MRKDFFVFIDHGKILMNLATNIIDFIVSVVDPMKNESILDPACGTAGFLISSFKHILSQNTKLRIMDGGDYNLSGNKYKETIKLKKSEYELFEIKDICEIVRGSSPRPKADPKYYGGNVPRLMISDVTRDGMYSTPSTDFLTEEGAKLSRPMKKGDVVVAVSGNPGFPTILKVDACIHDGFVGFRNLSPKVLPEFLYYYLLHQKENSNSQSVGAIFKNLTTDQIKQIKSPSRPCLSSRRLWLRSRATRRSSMRIRN